MGKPNKMSEKQTISSILSLARKEGCEEKVKGIIQKYQDAVNGAKNDYERKHIAAMGLAEIHKTIGCVGGLVVDGVEVLPPDLGYQEDINWSKGLVRLD